MATYRSQLITVPSPEPQGYAASLRVTERPVYGSSRLGTYARWEELYDHPVVSTPAPDPVQPVDLNYELTDHLGNVTAVVTGRLLNGNGGGTPKQAELVSAQGYEAFGSLLPGRNYSSGSYRFGFGGQEKDDEISGATGTSYTAEFWQYDPRTGRRWNRDPLSAQAPGWSPYRAFFNSPLLYTDPNGAFEDDYSLSRDGSLQLIRETDDDFDRIFASTADDSGDGALGESITVSKNFVKGHFGSMSKPCNRKANSFFISNNVQEQYDAYRFFAINTDVEWQLNVFGTADADALVATLATTFDEGQVDSHGLIAGKVLRRSPALLLTRTSHSHPGVYDSRTGWPAYPSGFLPSGKPGTKASGDRLNYQFMHAKYAGRVPDYFEIFVPSNPRISVIYNDQEMIRVHELRTFEISR